MKKKASVLITDLDNTLFDWLDIWYSTFSAMFDELVRQTSLPRETLEKEFKVIHERHGTSEYAFSINELPSIISRHPPGTDLAATYASAIEAFRQARRSHMRSFPGVISTLEGLRARGTLIIGYTESMAFYTGYRMRKLGLDRLIDYLYSPPDHELPQGKVAEAIRHHPPGSYEFQHTIHRHTPKDELKPNPALLLDIIRQVQATVDETVYVGDSKMKDIFMAQKAGVTDVWAKYGAGQHRDEYELLRRVTHWSDADVERERQILKGAEGMIITPTYTLEHSFEEIVDHFDFFAFTPP